MEIAFFARWLGRPQKPASISTADGDKTEGSDAESQFCRGRRFADGEGMAQDDAQAAEWYLKAAEQGHCVAQFNLGLMYGRGQGVLRDEVQAVMWLRKAADLGHAGAQYQLGIKQHRASRSGPQVAASECRTEAFKWLHLAMAQGYRGSESAREYVALGMTKEEADEGGRRAAAFAVAPVQRAGDL